MLSFILQTKAKLFLTLAPMIILGVLLASIILCSDKMRGKCKRGRRSESNPGLQASITVWLLVAVHALQLSYDASGVSQ